MDAATKTADAALLAPRQRAVALLVGLLTASALMVLLASALVAANPVHLVMTGSNRTLIVAVDGHQQTFQLSQPVTTIVFPAYDPLKHEYLADGSDSTNNFTYQQADIAAIEGSLYYRFQAALRDESSLSTWRHLAVRETQTGIVQAVSAPAISSSLSLPSTYRIDIDLYRPETPRSLQLLEAGGTVTLTLDRNNKYVSIVEDVAGTPSNELAHWFFPEQVGPSLAEVLFLVLRAIALGLVLTIAIGVLALFAPSLPRLAMFEQTGWLMVLAAIVCAAGALWTSFALFARSPHILDAVSYVFQARVFASGELSAPAPADPNLVPIPFMVVHAGKWFSQYPPGAAATLAPFMRAGIPWVAEPLLAAGSGALIVALARRHYAVGVAAITVVLVSLSPFLWLQGGSYLSHVPALFYAVAATYAATRYEGNCEKRWAAAAAIMLGCAFLTREVVALIYGVAIAGHVLWTARNGKSRDFASGVTVAIAVGLLFVAAYLAYNWLQTGSPATPPRALFSPGDRLGFGDHIGFYGRHTIAAGLVNTDELLTSLGFDLYGWPVLFTLAFIPLPFVFKRATSWDVLYLAIAAMFVGTYIAYFYHGIALGPRYYFEALPAFVLLTARGMAVLAGRAGDDAAAWRGPHATGGANSAVVLLLALLTACNLTFFLPHVAAVYQNYSGMPGRGGPALGTFVQEGVTGRTVTLHEAAVIVPDWWVFVTNFAVLDCPELNCDTVFIVGPDAPPSAAMLTAFPGRTWYVVESIDGTLQAQVLPTPK